MKKLRARFGMLLLAGLTAVFLTFIANSQGFQERLYGQNPVDPATLTGTYDPTDTVGTFHGQGALSKEIALIKSRRKVLGDSSAPRRIEVDLTKQTLYAYEGDKRVYEFLISSGKWYPTPTGTYHIWAKYRYIKMSGGNRAAHTYYYLPNVPFVMFFSNDSVQASRGFSLHGTYWHDNFGHPMSHGCVNMKTEEAELIYYWSQPVVGDGNSVLATRDDPGTEIIIYGETPRE